MAIETTAGGTMITGDDTRLSRIKFLKRVMEHDLQFGSYRGVYGSASPFKTVRKEFGIKARKKADIYAQFMACNGL